MFHVSGSRSRVKRSPLQSFGRLSRSQSRTSWRKASSWGVRRKSTASPYLQTPEQTAREQALAVSRRCCSIALLFPCSWGRGASRRGHDTMTRTLGARVGRAAPPASTYEPPRSGLAQSDPCTTTSVGRNYRLENRGLSVMNDSQPVIFFGYPFRPAVRNEAVTEAASRLETSGAIIAKPWEKLSINGRFIIQVILTTIDEADVAAFDVTELNHNVMFELGYAIGRNRKVWLFRDESNVPATRSWNRIKLLTTVGYSPFTNSEHIVNSFWEQRPHEAETTIFQTAVRDYLQPAGLPAIFYLPSLYETEAGRKLTRRIQHEEPRGLRCIVADPAESAVQS